MKIFSWHTVKTGLSILAMGVFTIAAKSAGDKAADNWQKAKADSEMDDTDDLTITDLPPEEEPKKKTEEVTETED